MTPEEQATIDAVTAKLTGTFLPFSVPQRVVSGVTLTIEVPLLAGGKLTRVIDDPRDGTVVGVIVLSDGSLEPAYE